MDTPRPFSALAAQWKLLGVMALAFARSCLRQQRSRQSDTREKLEMLEVWLRAALFQLPRDIARLKSAHVPLCAEDEAALVQLYALTRALAAMYVLVQLLKAELARQALWKRAGSFTAPHTQQVMPCAASQRPGYIDTS